MQISSMTAFSPFWTSQHSFNFLYCFYCFTCWKMLCLVFYEERLFKALFKEGKNFRDGQHWNVGDLFLLKTGNKSLAFFLQKPKPKCIYMWSFSVAL